MRIVLLSIVILLMTNVFVYADNPQYKQILVWRNCKVERSNANDLIINTDGCRTYLDIKQTKTMSGLNKVTYISPDLISWNVTGGSSWELRKVDLTDTAVEVIDEKMLYVFNEDRELVAQFELK